MSNPSRPHEESVGQTDETPPTRYLPAEAGPSLTPAISARVQDTVGFSGQVGRYRVLKLLGRGGMGSVYLAEDSVLGRQVALKVPRFRPEEDDALERFYREARTAGRLQHPNICPVYDVGEADGIHYLSMAYIEGEPLSARTQDYARRPPREAAALVRTLALALEEAHRQGVIHRDLKPSNVMINRRGEPVVMDFGLARQIQTPSARQTHQGTVLGTPAYMSPEQARGDVTATGPSSDVYSLGMVLYELLVGDVPFAGPTMDVLVRQVRDDPIPPSQQRPDLDPHIEAICLKAVAKEPSRRFLSMTEFAQSLEEYLNGVPPQCASQPLVEADPLEQGVADILVLLRTWGPWAGIDKVKARFAERPDGEQDQRLVRLVKWLQGEAALREEVVKECSRVRQLPALTGWALVEQACAYNRDHNFDQADAVLREAVALGDPRDNILQASLAHQRGFSYPSARGWDRRRCCRRSTR